MALSFTTADETLLGRLGKIARAIAHFHYWQRAAYTLHSGPLEDIMAMYDTRRDLVTGVPGHLESQRTAGHQYLESLRQLAIQTVTEMVAADNPTYSKADLTAALEEIITQMLAGGHTVQANTIASTVSTITGTGTGQVVVSTKRPDGLVNENAFQETALVECIADGDMDVGVPYFHEKMRYRGDYAAPHSLHHDWPIGSGANKEFRSIGFPYHAGGGNLLTNSSFQSWSGAPAQLENWTLSGSGAWGTDLAQNAATPFYGTYDLKFVGGANNPIISQQFRTSTGTAGELKPETQYAGAFWARADVNPAAGVITIDLYDTTGAATVNDQQGVANSYALTCNGLPTAHTNVAAKKFFVFRTPRNLPANITFRIQVTTDISVGSQVFLGGLAFGEMTETYPGGIAVAAFTGATTWRRKDKVTVTTTNDRGGTFKSGTITGATAAAPCVITSATHGLTSGDKIYIEAGVGNLFTDGTNGIGGRIYNVTVVDPNSFSLGGATTTGLTYTSGGKWFKYPFLGDYQCSFDRLFDMRLKGLLLPSSGTPTAADIGNA